MMAFMIQMFSGQFIMLDYYFNTVAYEKNCENKTRPKLHCNGQCQAMKKVRQQEKQEQENTTHKQDNINKVISAESFFGCVPVPFPGQSIIAELQLNPNVTDRSFSVFHPPQV